MYQEMNKNVKFILAEKGMILEIIEENEDLESGCISLLQESNLIKKLYDIISGDGVLVLADQVIINKQNDVLAVTLLLETGRSIRQKKTLSEADLVALISIISNEEFRCRYE